MSNNASTNTTTLQDAEKLGILPQEYDEIKNIMGRTPNLTELSIYGVMWSEHCAYKNSIVHLKTLPRKGKNLLAEAGAENAGLVSIDDTWACAFKIESHNHPSALEPYQGAATGVGGINRDIFTVGARPIAQLNSLRFGDPTLAKTKWLVDGVVRGIGDYGNSFGVPVVGGEVYFDPCYNTNPLVNAFSLGLVRKDGIISATAGGVGNGVFIVGSLTGKDGINGAAFASKDLDEASEEDLPSVQVGDPFQEKLLLEATLELAQTDAIIGMQDMGAAGIICSTSEMSAAGECGMKVDLSQVPLRQTGMKPYEILLSESQERMLVVIKKGREQEVQSIFEKWDLYAVQIGEVVEGDTLTFYHKGECVADVQPSSLVLGGGAPQYRRESRVPSYVAEAQKFHINQVQEPSQSELLEITKKLIGLPNIASKRWISQQYDSTIGTVNTNTNVPRDAATALVKETDEVLLMTVDCNSHYVHADPETGAMIAVAEAARNIRCSGGEPLAITNCLNFGNPYDPEAFWQFENAVKGMKHACEAFETPVTGGNVSFYNQTTLQGKTTPVHPTPVIGMIGKAPSTAHLMSLDFKSKSDLIYLLGDVVEDIHSSEYLYNVHGIKNSPPPHFALEQEMALHTLVHGLITERLIQSAHDVSEGGLITTLLEKSFGSENKLGFDILTVSEVRMDAFLFGEAQGRVVVSVPLGLKEAFVDYVESSGIDVPALLLGHVTRGDVRVDDQSWGSVQHFEEVYEETLPVLMNE